MDTEPDSGASWGLTIVILGLFDKLGITWEAEAPKLVTLDTRLATVEPAVWLLLLFALKSHNVK